MKIYKITFYKYYLKQFLHVHLMKYLQEFYKLNYILKKIKEMGRAESWEGSLSLWAQCLNIVPC